MTDFEPFTYAMYMAPLMIDYPYPYNDIFIMKATDLSKMTLKFRQPVNSHLDELTVCLSHVAFF